MDNFFEILFSNTECIVALQNSENLENLVMNLKPHFPEISADKVRELFSIPSGIQDDFCLDYIFTLFEKMESMAKEDDGFLAAVAGGSGDMFTQMNNYSFAPGGNTRGMGQPDPSIGSYMTTAAYIGLGTQVLGGGMSITNTMLGGREQRKTQAEGFEQQKALITLNVDQQIRLLQAQRGF